MVNQTPEKTVRDDIDKQLDAAVRIVHAKNIDLAANKGVAFPEYQTYGIASIIFTGLSL